MRRTLVIASLVAAPLVLGACASSATTELPAARQQDGSSFAAATPAVAVQDGQLVVRNTTEEPIAYAALERHYFETLFAAWCFGADGCGTPLKQGESRATKLADVPGYSATANEALVFWWPVRAGTTPEQKAQSVQRISVPLK